MILPICLAGEKRKHIDGVLVILVFQLELNKDEMLLWQLAEIKQVQFLLVSIFNIH